jgi:murein DD-endopeptidase MepM/ murein hydrolase activator NlpD
MKIYRALKTNKITQPFGVNWAPYYKKMGMKGHNGIDWGAKWQEPLYWDCNIQGTVTKIMIDNKLGWGIYVMTVDKDGAFQHRFWHLNAIFVKVGQVLDSGHLLGWADTTGIALGCHLHRDLKPLKRDVDGYYKIADYNNGYFGAVDYKPYLENIFVKDYIKQLEDKISWLQKIIEKIKKLLGL